MIILAAQNLGQLTDLCEIVGEGMPRVASYSLGFTLSRDAQELDLQLSLLNFSHTSQFSNVFDISSSKNAFNLCNGRFKQGSRSKGRHFYTEPNCVKKIGSINFNQCHDPLYIEKSTRTVLLQNKKWFLLDSDRLNLENFLDKRPQALAKFSDLVSDYVRYLSVSDMREIQSLTDPETAVDIVDRKVTEKRHQAGKDNYHDWSDKPSKVTA